MLTNPVGAALAVALTMQVILFLAFTFGDV